MLVRMVGATDIGRRRKTNQDSIFFDEPAGLGIVADGIGGRKGGEIASSIAVNGLRKAFMNSDRIRHEEIKPFLITAIDQINREIIDRGTIETEVAGMGTTINCAMFVGDKLHLAHIGDSRTYMYYEKHLFLLTLDHNVANFVERGWLPRANIQAGARDSALVRAIGLTHQCEVDLYEVKLRKGQIFLTCSDGLTGMVEDKAIAKIISENLNNFNDLPQILIDEANKNGGKDNITVLLSQVKGAA